MKNGLLISVFVIIANIASTSAQNVNIPDANFKAALVANTNINTNGDAEIQVSEAAFYAGTLDVSNMGISDLTGIEAFTSLTELSCYGNQLTSLDFSFNTALSLLNCQNNNLSSLNISSNILLTSLICYFNSLTSLNLSANTALTHLECFKNQLSGLNVSANTALSLLSCSYNQITSLNVSSNTALAYLNCSSNQLTSLNVSSNTALTHLYCEENQLTGLNISGNAALTELHCYDNHLMSLNLSANTALTFLRCTNNQLTSLNIQNGYNSHLLNFFAFNNPGLSCIQVDDTVYMNTNFSFAKDAWANYSVNCSVDIPNYFLNNTVLTNPNPTTGTINLSDYYNVIITDISGRVILEKQNTNTLDVSKQPAGMYFILFTDSKGKLIQRSKVTKE